MARLLQQFWNEIPADAVSRCVSVLSSPVFPGALSSDEYVVLPGFCDVHVHFREPGFSYKETISSGSMAAAHGGYTAVATMPNLNPVPDSVDALELQRNLIRSNAVINVLPYGALTVGEKGEQMADLSGMAPNVIGFSDDGKGIQREEMMLSLMCKAKDLGKIIAAHCEDNSLLRGGYIHDGQYAAEHGHKGICSESEWGQIERDLFLAEKTGCAYHVCHISTKESVDLIRKAKARGVNVTSETGPHYLIFDDMDLQESGWWKMNPPIRSAEDRAALIEGILDGTIDMIATDHAPHSLEEKSRGLQGSAFGIVGLETAFPAMYTHLVKPGILSMEKLIELMAVNPRKRFALPFGDGFSVWNLNEKQLVDPESFLSMGRATPFAGMELYGVNHFTYCNGNIAYKQK